MKPMEAIKARCSIREFGDIPVAKELIEEIVDCARLAPTARKEEPWEFIAVCDKERLKELACITDHGKFIEDAACAILTVCRQTKYYLEDGCAATENMLIAARSLGIGSCWVAGDKKTYCDNVLGLFKVPSGYKLVSIIAFGYPKNGFRPLAKRQLKDVLHWEKF